MVYTLGVRVGGEVRLVAIILNNVRQNALSIPTVVNSRRVRVCVPIAYLVEVERVDALGGGPRRAVVQFAAEEAPVQEGGSGRRRRRGGGHLQVGAEGRRQRLLQKQQVGGVGGGAATQHLHEGDAVPDVRYRGAAHFSSGLWHNCCGRF